MSYDKDTNFSIVLPVLVTATEDAFKSFHLNVMKFVVNNPREVMGAVFRELVPRLRNSSIHACPHHNRLYFILRKELTGFIEIMRSTLDEVLGTYREKGYVVYDMATISCAELRPPEEESHFIVTRSLVYDLLKGYITSRRASKFVKLESRGREGLIVYYDTLFSEETEAEDGTPTTIDVNRYLRLVFEVTPRGRGRVWFDISTRARLSSIAGRDKDRYLSHHEMKRRSGRLYDTYRKHSQPQPRERYDAKMRVIEDIIEGILSNLCYYVYIPDWRGFNEVCLKFVPLHQVSKGFRGTN